MTSINIPVPPELAELAHRFNAMPTAADRRRAARAVCSVLEAIEGRAVTQEAEAKFRPHPMDLLILAVVQERGVVNATALWGELDGETYPKNGRLKDVGERTLHRRLRALAAGGVLRRTTAGYAIADAARVEEIEDIDFGG